MTSQPRPVWLTQEQRDLLNDFLVTDVVDAWDAAPADAAEAIAAWLGEHFTGLDEYDRAHLDEIAASLLGALGCPHTEQA